MLNYMFYVSLQECLQLSVLCENIKMKEYIKPKGRPKQISKLWPSKNKKWQREKENQLCCNAQPVTPRPKRRKTCQTRMAANRMRIKRELKRKESDKSGESLSDVCIALSSDDEEADSSKEVYIS